MGPLVAEFRRRFGPEPATSVRAPGRVNLIGEHTDYSLLPVLPAAIDRAITLAAGPHSHRVVLESLHFPDRADLVPARLPERAAGWLRYPLAVLRSLPISDRGARMLVGGDLPHTGGLSSSSALTVGILEALNRVWELGLDRERLVGLAVAAERATGVEGGAMDQTVILHARAGTALRIDFQPPGRRFVVLPEGLRLVVGYSGVSAPKGEAARHEYNRRVVACRVAAVLLAGMAGVEAGEPLALVAVAGLPGVGDLVGRLPETATPAEAAVATGTSPTRLVALTADELDPARPVEVAAAARHVLAEAARVDRAEEALVEADLPLLGRLLDESHRSLQAFGTSNAGLDRLVQAMRAGGAYGARLTGAGFGGWAVAAVPPERVEAVVTAAVAATGGPAFEVKASDGVA